MDTQRSKKREAFQAQGTMFQAEEQQMQNAVAGPCWVSSRKRRKANDVGEAH